MEDGARGRVRYSIGEANRDAVALRLGHQVREHRIGMLRVTTRQLNRENLAV